MKKSTAIALGVAGGIVAGVGICFAIKKFINYARECFDEMASLGFDDDDEFDCDESPNYINIAQYSESEEKDNELPEAESDGESNELTESDIFGTEAEIEEDEA